MAAKPAAEITAVVICDQVRREQSGKDLIIGAYGGDIFVPSFPAAITLSLWIEHNFVGVGPLALGFRVRTDRGTEVFRAEFVAHVNEEITSGGLSLGEFPVPLTDPCELLVEIRQHSGEWRFLKKKAVLRQPSSKES